MRALATFLALVVAVLFPAWALAAEPMDSERAVALGADWLAAHQLADGSWSFAHSAGSWILPGEVWSAHCGRVYCTALATMILSVEHGKLPLFRK